MKFVLFRGPQHPDSTPGILTERGVVDISALIRPGHDPQQTMVNLIDDYDVLKGKLAEAAENLAAIALDSVQLGPPLPRPGKMLNCIGNYREHRDGPVGDLNMFLKNPDCVIGPDDTIRLPEFEEPTSFMHEAELALVMKGPSKDVPVKDWREAVFGYTTAIDVTARGEGRFTWKKLSWLGKSFDTFAPLGPCIVTIDEIEDPNNLHVRFWNDGQLRHDYNTSDMEYPVPEVVAFATKIMTIKTGDVISCGTNHEGLGYLQNREVVRIEIEGIGEMTLDVVDPLSRSWERGVYMGADSTNHDAIALHRPELKDTLK
jgi:2-keto-4-pentenoate hydratase/2-oxohepta-3-ene-1,7-dioic acid hydratase in catechol pathway